MNERSELMREYDAIANAIVIVARLRYQVEVDKAINAGYLILERVSRHLFKRNNEIAKALQQRN